ncbi:hypothetical protein E9232_004898 [Inquilinus ginsengisoli]|uniref:Uncharacterized protein n=1 Tax=Inquilinus ginsengisoli TaxID=363840 RepID=A0ABU1JVM6_9PROT|nr:hypothetical protein [Inquilinus ginsengisoli]MDR6292358.1 hypothetical protein [Inquilinus ginsengisoli]
MAGPWEKYAQPQTAPVEAGPWAKYAAAPAQEEAPAVSPLDAMRERQAQMFAQRVEAGKDQMRGLIDPRMQSAVMQGATLGGADEALGGIAGAIGGTIGDAINGRAPSISRLGENIGQGVDLERQNVHGFEQDHPGLSAGATVGGGLLLGAPFAGALKQAPGLAMKLLQGTLLGGGAGATAGFLSGEGGIESRLAGAGTGAAVGGLLGAAIPATGALVRKGSDAFKTLFRMRPAEEQANRLMATALRRDSLDPTTASAQMAKAGDQPVAPADLGPNMQRLLGSAYRAPGQGRAQISELLDARGALRPQRLGDIIRQSFGNQDDFYSTIDSLQKVQSANAKPLYDALRKADPATFNTDEMKEILNTPAGMRAINAAEQRAKNLREPFPQLLENVTDPATGETMLKVTKIPNFEALDQVKRSLDNIIEDARDPISGKIPSEVRDIVRVRGDLIDEMDAVTSASPGDPASSLYRQARGAFAGPAQSQDALWLGRDIAKGGGDLEPLLRKFGKLSDADKDMARLGVARQLAEMVSRGSETRNQALGFLSPQMRGRLEAIFPDRASYEALEDAVRRESQMVGTDRAARSGSQTAERLTEDADQGAQLANLGEMAQIGESLLSMNPMRIARTGIGVAARRAQGMSEPVSKELAQRLLASDPAARAQVMQQLQQQMFTPKPQRPIAGLLSGEARVAIPGLLGSYTAPTANR